MGAIGDDVLRDRFRGCMVGLAVGDALGMPVETLTPEEIRQATGGRGVEGYLAPLQRRFHSTTLLAPGQWTDDTQLSLAIVRSLVRRREFDLADIAAEHVVEYGKVRRGWGESTKIGVREIAEGTRTPGDPVLDPKAIGLGNGVAMKIAPLALVTAPIGISGPQAAYDALVPHTLALASLTHRDPCAATGAVLVGLAIHSMLAVGPQSLDAARLRRWTTWVARLFEAADQCPTHPRAFVGRLTELPKTVDLAATAAITGTTCTVYESVPFVIGTIMHHGGNFRAGVLAAVNAGGDTDSNGAMVGATLGAYHGFSAIPREWVDGLEAHEEIIALADQLLALVASE